MTVSMRIHLPSSCFPIKAVLSKKDRLEKAVERAEVGWDFHFPTTNYVALSEVLHTLMREMK